MEWAEFKRSFVSANPDAGEKACDKVESMAEKLTKAWLQFTRNYMEFMCGIA